MGVDHGLQGKEGIKKREKRLKKAKHTHHVVGKAGLIIGKKKELVFNDEARTEWLSGFHKRKQQKRQYGLTMGILKEKKARLDSRREMRQATDAILQDRLQSEEEEEENNNNEKLPKTAVETFYNDESTLDMFGGEVSVVIDNGVVDTSNIPDICSDADEEDEQEEKEGKQKNNIENSNEERNNYKKKTLTRFDRAQHAAKIKMQQKPGRQGGKKRYLRSNKTRLLHKAMGSGTMGKNDYKGSKKKRRK
eukprot:CAMPEP_0182427008 /NCGR_PEP_ID=MMETSP1167-20130531/13520_1 /TAXON_ID=2988 /ORGANISM="Mallomonas Sp, Strain CCMP3275" /LENGTH=248 /DNA_ID=CAMNT_0024608813 /DNA_START=258 /DNA_END=1004 /DNA_ORIENTATION=-